MSVTILEALVNAEVNLVQNRGNSLAFELGKSQLQNAIRLLEAGHDIYSEVWLDGEIVKEPTDERKD